MSEDDKALKLTIIHRVSEDLNHYGQYENKFYT